MGTANSNIYIYYQREIVPMTLNSGFYSMVSKEITQITMSVIVIYYSQHSLSSKEMILLLLHR